ncbi:TIR domain-containing protein [Acinetobacter sp. 194]|uniref:toll/interleukin-1 receptor domain-containing protein n=1 Tax=Acinetobacter shaoyimingii TaxID=2715164 RepID=UPI00140B56BE|nr:toll/interleukin-1 receptor domain-containing protein [Acinetobacter shaoyimingii]NHB56670.1 TIR domain-containing protein [Acinetobacter shaoyimingii]
MSISTISNNITRLLKEIADLRHKKSLESKKENAAKEKILSIQKTITKNTSLTTLNSKMSEISRKEKEASDSQSKQADFDKKLADKEGRLLKERQALAKAENVKQKKLEAFEKKRQREQLDFQRKLKQEISRVEPSYQSIDTVSDNEKYDFFISHASEDKEEFVKPLAETLESMGIRVWYDEFSLKVGDSLTKSIDQGLINSKFGVIVLSKAFMKKQWTNYEFKSLVSREMHHGEKVILPIWHEISKNDVMAFSPHLADKVALNSLTQTIEEIASDLKDVLQ